jgi:tetratricopeptide (TPR) repeat protein
MSRQWIVRWSWVVCAIAWAGLSWGHAAALDRKADPHTAAVVERDAGMALLRQGKAAEAVIKLRAAVNLEPTDWEFLDPLLAAYIQTGEYGGKAHVLEREEHFRKRLGNTFVPTKARAVELMDMGLDYTKIEMLTAAQRCYEAALAIREKSPGPAHPDTARTLLRLAESYRATGDYAKGAPFEERALAIYEKTSGPESHDAGVCVNGLALLYQAMGNYTKAEPLFQRALAIDEKTLGPEKAETATNINNLGSLYWTMGNYAKAEPLFQRALAIKEKTLGEQNRDTAISLDSLALLYRDEGDYAKAAPFAQRALAIREKTLGESHRETGVSCANVAEIYQAMGEFAKAEPLLQRAVAIFEKTLGPQHPETAISLNNLAALYGATGAYAKAESLYERSLAIREKALGPQHPDVAISLANLAAIQENLGNYAKAQALFQRALEIDEKALGPFHPHTAGRLDNLAGFYKTMGDDAKAEPLYQRALAIREKALGPQHPDVAASLNSLADFFEACGEYAKPEPLFVRALAIREKTLGPMHPETANSLNNLAELYRKTGKAAKAEPLLVRALSILETKMGPQYPGVGLILNNLAALYESMGDLAKAEPMMTRALALRERTLGLQHPDTGTTANNLGELYAAKGDYQKAEPLLLRALAIKEKALGPEHPDLAVSLANLALLDIDLGKRLEALEFCQREAKVTTAHLGNILSFTSEQERLAFQKTVFPFSLPASLDSAPDIAEAVLHYKGVVLDSLLEDRLVAEASRNAAQRKVIDQLRAARQRLTQLLMEASKNLSPEAMRGREAEREARAREVEQLEGGLARAVAGLGKARRALSVTVGQAQSALASDQALVELLRYGRYLGNGKWEAHYGAVVVGAEVRWVPLGVAAEIEKDVRIYGKSVRGQTDETALRAVLMRLYERLWAPIDAALPAGVKTIILSPDSDLNFVSFVTLLAPDERFLGEKYSIRYAASGRDLLREIAPSKGKGMTVFGGPDFGGRAKAAAGYFLLPLPGAAAECAALKTQNESAGISVQDFTGPAATEAQLKRTVSPRVLHLATHGFFLPEDLNDDPSSHGNSGMGGVTHPPGGDQKPKGLLQNPMIRSGLALTGAQRTLDAWARGEAPPSDNDGVVTAEEVGGLKLQGTWLVTLSACDTGVGEARAGEGVMGLRRGFIQAGAQNLLMTLWPISDDTTVKIMLDFYDRALKSGNAPQALADTQREWLVKLRKEKGLTEAVNLAGPFIMSSQGQP